MKLHLKCLSLVALLLNSNLACTIHVLEHGFFPKDDRREDAPVIQPSGGSLEKDLTDDAFKDLEKQDSSRRYSTHLKRCV